MVEFSTDLDELAPAFDGIFHIGQWLAIQSQKNVLHYMEEVSIKEGVDYIEVVVNTLHHNDGLKRQTPLLPTMMYRRKQGRRNR